MAAPKTDLLHICEPAHILRQLVDTTQLIPPENRGSPTLNSPGPHDGTRLSRTGTDLHYIRQLTNESRSQSGSCRPIPKLTVLIASPTHDRAGIDERTGMGSTRSHLNRSGNTRNSDRSTSVFLCAVSDLAVIVMSPTCDFSIATQSARVVGAS